MSPGLTSRRSSDTVRAISGPLTSGDQYAGRPVLVVAHSMGVSMALRLAYRHPELVRAVVALDGGAAAAPGQPGGDARADGRPA